MHAQVKKLTSSGIILVLIVAILPLIGLTVAEVDDRDGLMIDFGYWNANWTDVVYTDDMNGLELLTEACHIRDYDLRIEYDEKGDFKSVISVNGQQALVGEPWGFYTCDGGSSWVQNDPIVTEVADIKICCWARAVDASAVLPPTDFTGFSYFSYGVDGKSAKTGEPLKVVSLAPSVTETLVSVGGIDLIVGTDLYSNYPQEIVDRKNSGAITVIGGYTDPNYEWILRLGPDIVFCDGGTGEHVSMADKLRKSGINCVVLYNSVEIETTFENIWITAAALGFSDNATNVINKINTSIGVVSGHVATQPIYRVFAALSAVPSPWTCGSDTYMNDVIATAVGKNIFEDQQASWFMVSKEQIYMKQPQVIIIISDTCASYDEYLTILKDLDPLWKETPAYKDGNVYVFGKAAADVLSRPGPRLGEAVELVAKALHPDVFRGLDPADVLPKYVGDDYSEYIKYTEPVV